MDILPDEVEVRADAKSGLTVASDGAYLAALSTELTDDLVKEAKKRLEIIADTFLSVNTPSQHALIPWLKDKASIQDQILQRVRDNLTFLQDQIQQIPSCRMGGEKPH